jgi:hypothetical protein
MILASECVEDTYPLGSFVRYEHFFTRILPTVQSRIDATWKYLTETAPNVIAALVGLLAYDTLKKAWPDAPEPRATITIAESN